MHNDVLRAKQNLLHSSAKVKRLLSFVMFELLTSMLKVTTPFIKLNLKYKKALLQNYYL